MMTCTITFPETSHPSVTLPVGTCLSEQLTVLNSPVLFGCRTGICGTCLVTIEAGHDPLQPADTDEQEALDVYAPKNPTARLACKIYLNADIALKKIESA